MKSKEIINCFALGQCGARLGKIFERNEHKVSYFNYDKIDALDIKGIDYSPQLKKGNKLVLSGHGTGRSIKKGSSLLHEHERLIIEFIESNFNKEKINVLLLGLGGGTGTSSVKFFADKITELGGKYAIIATIPHLNASGGLITRQNAFLTLRTLKEERYSFFLLADNEHLIKTMQVNVLSEGWEKINEKIVNNFLNLFNITQNKNTGKGVGSIDDNELLRVLIFGKGLLSTLNFTINFEDIDNIGISELLTHQELAKGYDYKNAQTYCITFIVPNGIKIPNNVENLMGAILDKFNRLSISEGGFYGTFYSDDLTNKIKVIALANGLPMPSSVATRIKNLHRDIDRANEKKEKIKEKTNSAFNELTTIQSNNESEF